MFSRSVLKMTLSYIFVIKSGRPEVFCKKAVREKFAKFAGKHLCHSLFFDKFY